MLLSLRTDLVDGLDATVLRSLGELSEGLKICREMIKLKESVLGPNHRDTIEAKREYELIERKREKIENMDSLQNIEKVKDGLLLVKRIEKTGLQRKGDPDCLLLYQLLLCGIILIIIEIMETADQHSLGKEEPTDREGEWKHRFLKNSTQLHKHLASVLQRVTNQILLIVRTKF